MKNFVEVLKNNPNHAYDHIANEGYKMTKDELVNVAKELLYVIYDNNTKEEHDNMLASVADELGDYIDE